MALSFEQKLDNYADLIIRVGLNLQEGQRLVVRAPVQAADFTRRVVERAYEAGAPYVDVLWSDEALTLTRFEHAPDDSFELFPEWMRDALIRGAERGDAMLSIRASDPELLKDQDPDKVATVNRVTRQELKPFSQQVSSSAINWCLLSVPIESWAAKVFPDAPEDEQMAQLWEAIFKTVRADLEHPVAAWREHLDALERRRAYLNEKQFRALRYRGKGTDLEVGLVENHLWLGGTQPTQDGVIYVANLPTEEVFTAPHKSRVEGKVHSSKPLAYSGTLIDDFELTFKDGKVVEARAGQGEETLHRLLETDEGARRLGEVALVPEDSPIARSGLLFYDTLFDENAASHLALGRAYSFTVQSGADLSDEEAATLGLNDSLTHVDFMIGGPDIDIDGVLPDGSEEPVMRDGNWSLDVEA